jgi:dynein heavy chain
MSDLFEEVLKVQRTWMYLEPIFSSGDIGMTMPAEAKAFMQVDKLWKDTMEGVD